MKNIIAALCLLGLTACTGMAVSVPNPITQDRLVAVESSYGVILSAAVAYHDACDNKVLKRSNCAPVVDKMQRANKIAMAALVKARNYADRTSIGYLDAIQAAYDAVQIFLMVQKENGVT